MPDQPASPRRRVTDLHDQLVEQQLIILFREELADTRHALRNELALIRQDVQVGNLADVNERAEIKAALGHLDRGHGQLRHDVDELQEDVETLKAKSLAADEVSSLKRWLLGATAGVVGVVLATAAFLAQHVH